MTRNFLASLVLFTLGGVISSFAAPESAGEEKPSEMSYADLRVNIKELAGDKVTVRGGFHYLHSDGQIFELRMGDSTVDVRLDRVAEETRQSIMVLRNFSAIPLTVTGTVIRGGVKRDRIVIIADKIDIQDTSTRRAFESRKGIVTMPEIVRNPSRFLHYAITMQGRFEFRDPSREVLHMWRGADSVEVDYKKLDEATRTEILSEMNFSDRSLTVVGRLEPATSPQGGYVIFATSVKLEPIPDPSQQAALEAAHPHDDVTYADLLKNPTKYVNKEVLLKGGYEVADPMRQVFEVWHEGDSIEIFYKDLPAEQIQAIENLKPFSGVALAIKGMVEPYPNARQRYFILAQSVEFEKAQ